MFIFHPGFPGPLLLAQHFHEETRSPRSFFFSDENWGKWKEEGKKPNSGGNALSPHSGKGGDVPIAGKETKGGGGGNYGWDRGR